MIQHKYGECTVEQMNKHKNSLRKSIFWLLLYKDPNVTEDYTNVDYDKYFNGLMCRIAGLNELFGFPPDVITLLSMLQAAKQETEKDEFEFKTYRKLILDAGSLAEKMNIGG